MGDEKDFVFTNKLRRMLSQNTILVTAENPLSIIYDEQI